MNFYKLLTQGDAGLNENHHTSILFYLLQLGKDNQNGDSFFDYFIKNIKHINDSIGSRNFTISNVDIRIEEILKFKNKRRDTDITIDFVGSPRLIVNIENKVSYASLRQGQIGEQEKLLKIKYPDAEIISLLVLPFEMTSKDLEWDNVLYWVGDNSICSLILSYCDTKIDQFKNGEVEIYFYIALKSFIEEISDNFLQQSLSMIHERGKKNLYRYSMYEYLQSIAVEWNTIFGDSVVVVQDLLAAFENRVIADLEIDHRGSPDLELMKNKFRKGAKEAQPKIFTINEKNRVHFGTFSPKDRALFYYPNFDEGVQEGQWKDRPILPINQISKSENPIVYYRDKESKAVTFKLFKEIGL